MAKQANRIRQIRVDLINTTTGQEKVVTVPDTHSAVTGALMLFAHIEGISVRLADIRIAPVGSCA